MSSTNEIQTFIDELATYKYEEFIAKRDGKEFKSNPAFDGWWTEELKPKKKLLPLAHPLMKKKHKQKKQSTKKDWYDMYGDIQF